MKFGILSMALASSLMALTAACDKPGEDAQKKEVQANQELTQAKVEANQKVNTAQAEADQKVARAEADFNKDREDYRHTRQTDLADLDKKIADVEAKAKKATGKTKTDLEAALPSIHAQRDAFAADLNRVSTATATTWDSTKAQLDKEYDSLKTAVNKAD